MSGSKNIAYMIPHSEFAGGERVIFDLCSRLDPSHFRPHVILPRSGGLSKRFEEIGVPVAIVPFRRDIAFGYPLAFNPLSIKRIKKQLLVWRCDLLHLNDSYLSLLGGIAGKMLNIPVTLTAHGIWDAHFIIQDVANRLFLNRIWAPSALVTGAMVQHGIVNASRVARVPFGVDVEKFAPGAGTIRTTLGISPDDVVVIRVARFDTVKDYPGFLKTAGILAEKYKNVHFMVLGDVTLNIKSENKKNKDEFLEFLERRPTLKQRVHFLGYKTNVPEYLAAADILVSSSISESFPINLLEGMSAGLPVVSTRVGAVDEIIEDGVHGCLVPARDPVALAESVARLIDDPGKRKKMGQEARKKAVASFNLEKFADTMQEQYRLVLDLPAQ
ncbi:MAG: D-inositol-3-phosphate glycosyltransferase [Elusimicrobia bacterium]|nr:D-inositol-3-phosphate glycosyltransferase [Elusimicrobiota bacterium]